MNGSAGVRYVRQCGRERRRARWMKVRGTHRRRRVPRIFCRQLIPLPDAPACLARGRAPCFPSAAASSAARTDALTHSNALFSDG